MTRNLLHPAVLKRLRSLNDAFLAGKISQDDYADQVQRLDTDEGRQEAVADRVREVLEDWRLHVVETIGKRNDPSIFDPGRLKAPATHRRVIEHFLNSDRGVFLHGLSGAGKTWTALLAAQALLAKHPGIECRAISCTDLRERLLDLSKRPDDKREFIENLGCSEVLLIDDAFHGISESFVESFRRILDHHEGRIIITCNWSIAELGKRTRGTAIARGMATLLRRIEDSCDSFSFIEEITF